ncbi:hypothetical protein [Marimonas arenosa]|uniref:Uncharacterized protein n=1 Tax=Marimonas arenosa TaxID=1795305 RepID=A0AAE3WB03_9RHOB|nr:hypothetical protein [Marimonas arenosa]MDQ2089160.1 hypothetical protein [Marimonas arenosa]
MALSPALPARATGAGDCDQPVCLVSPQNLALAHVITFDDVQSSLGIGHPIDGLLIRPGARFGERFSGQSLDYDGDYDRIAGAALSPLTVIPGAPGATLGAMRLGPTTVLHGHGPRAFPRVEAVGEGAIAIEFDNDQAALAFDLRGGEDGALDISFLRRDGSEIARLRIEPLGEERYGFVRGDNVADIAGILITNSDPQGIAIDNLAFDKGQFTG